jgi:transcriptional regulator with XRE-family HTH domain
MITRIQIFVQAQTGPPQLAPQNRLYTVAVPRKPKSTRGPRPRQGAHLLALRKAAGLTQIELAQFLGVPQGTIALWEWSDKPPRSDTLPKMAKALDVRIEQLLVQHAAVALTKPPGPIGEVQRTFEEVRRLPRKQQRKIIEMVSAIVEQYKRKAS